MLRVKKTTNTLSTKCITLIPPSGFCLYDF